jgi:hypothetical protein
MTRCDQGVADAPECFFKTAGRAILAARSAQQEP